MRGPAVRQGPDRSSGAPKRNTIWGTRYGDSHYAIALKPPEAQNLCHMEPVRQTHYTTPTAQTENFEAYNDGRDHNDQTHKRLGWGVPLTEKRTPSPVILQRRYDGTPHCKEPCHRKRRGPRTRWIYPTNSDRVMVIKKRSYKVFSNISTRNANLIPEAPTTSSVKMRYRAGTKRIFLSSVLFSKVSGAGV